MRELLTPDELQALLGQGHAALTGPGGNMDVILDVPVTLTVEAGRTQLAIRKLINLDGQALIRLDGEAAQPLRVYANGALIALGELAVDEGHPALRITAVLGPDERARQSASG